MAALDNPLETRVLKLETQIETERPHLATKADLREMETRLVKWIVGMQLTGATLTVLVLRSGLLGQ